MTTTDEIRERLGAPEPGEWEAGYSAAHDDIAYLLAEVERLRTQGERAVSQLNTTRDLLDHNAATVVRLTAQIEAVRATAEEYRISGTDTEYEAGASDLADRILATLTRADDTEAEG